jgi:hypothetical protein
MPSKKPLPIVSAAVNPAIAEEIERLAAANKVTRSAMVRQLLEERLTQRVNERQENAYDRLEKRLHHMEERFAGFMSKTCRAAAQGLYLTQVGLQYGHQRQEQKYLDKHWEDSRAFAGKYLENQMKKQQSNEAK